ncbi:hypothetical protein PMG11_00615 [Penicillium brasilianum]|uniref:F-box domain-containing protein n=1 Tax=Penicillium brasilianum TaxID=104259 RepID=A0A0F7TFL7_PENBI|nr:hypothetical protein PMG11_00615 [Penicillium brasilianum]
MLSFLELPGEIRLIIYAYLLHPNDYLSGYRQIETMITAHTDRSRGPSCADPRYYVERYTPSILLLNKQITSEALDVLHRIPLNLEGTPGTYLAMRQMDITEFISEELLQNIHYAILRLDFAHKHFVLPLLDIWGQRNNLKRLDVYRPRTTPIPRDHWKVVKSRIRTFSTTVPVIWHKVDDPLKADI